MNDLTRVHTLCHAFASHLVMNGVDLPTVGKLMGHSNVETTMIYAHLAPEHLTKAVSKLPFVRKQHPSACVPQFPLSNSNPSLFGIGLRTSKR